MSDSDDSNFSEEESEHSSEAEEAEEAEVRLNRGGGGRRAPLFPPCPQHLLPSTTV